MFDKFWNFYKLRSGKKSLFAKINIWVKNNNRYYFMKESRLLEYSFGKRWLYVRKVLELQKLKAKFLKIIRIIIFGLIFFIILILNYKCIFYTIFFLIECNWFFFITISVLLCYKLFNSD